MRTNLRAMVLLAAGAAMVGGVSLCSAEDVNAVWQPSQPSVPVTAGQGGAMWIPVPTEVAHALTGEAQEARQSSRAWQREAGPTYSVGNARIILPASR